MKGWSWLLPLNYARGRTCKKMAWAVKLKLKYFLSILFRRNFVNSQLKTVTGFGLSCSCDFRPILRNIAKLIYVNLVILDVIILSFKLFISCLYVNFDPDYSLGSSDPPKNFTFVRDFVFMFSNCTSYSKFNMKTEIKYLSRFGSMPAPRCFSRIPLAWEPWQHLGAITNLRTTFTGKAVIVLIIQLHKVRV